MAKVGTMIDLSGGSWNPDEDANAVRDTSQGREVRAKLPKFSFHLFLQSPFNIFIMLTPAKNAICRTPSLKYKSARVRASNGTEGKLIDDCTVSEFDSFHHLFHHLQDFFSDNLSI